MSTPDPASSVDDDGQLKLSPLAAFTSRKGKGKPSEKVRLDAAVIGTNNSSIVSKRSVERLYLKENEPQFLRYFVKKPHRRSPIINRGYWVRMQAVEYAVHWFLHEELPHLPVPKKKVVVNLGCGYDPLPFQSLSKENPNAEVLYVDIDYPELIAIKASIVSQTPELYCLLTDTRHHATAVDHVHYESKQYLALGCDLRDLWTLQRLFENHRLVDSAILFTAEVSLTYMDPNSVDDLLQWAANLPDARFSILEQILPSGPHHPFARTMLKHFESLSTPLKSVFAYPQLRDHIRRFSSRGWKSVDACDLLAFWSNRVSHSERERIATIQGEPFDEFEEFYIFCQHYFILYAHISSNPHTPFHSPSILWSAGGEYRRFPSTDSATSSDENTPCTRFSAEFTASPTLKRRFGAAASIGWDSLVYQGGQGQTARLGTSLCITHSGEGIGLAKRNGPGARVCHTMTALPNGKVLLVGGRTSPDKPLKDSWLLDAGVWKKVDDIPSARYRHSATVVPSDRILVYGGRGENRSTLGDWLLWSEDRGWRALPALGASLPSPRFSSGLCWTDHEFGVIGGGLDAKGDVLDDIWRLELHEDPMTGNETLRAFWSMVNVLSRRHLWKRFGGQMIYTGFGKILYIGGVSGLGLMKCENEILEVDCNKVYWNLLTAFYSCSHANHISRAIHARFPKDRTPFLIGHSVVCLQERVVICGGGGVCFSMGTCTNDGIWTLSGNEKYDNWRFIEEGQGLEDIQQGMDMLMPDSPIPETLEKGQLNGCSKLPDILDVKKVSISSAEEFRKFVEAGEPVVLQGLNIGTCVDSWTPEYLKSTVGNNRQVVVHMARSSAMSFQQKNFKYQTMQFGDFLDAAFPSLLPSSSQHPRLYFRSVSLTEPTVAPANLHDDFPELALDFALPAPLSMAAENLHSSPLRISSADVGMWLHYDGMANVLCHISGTKLFRLYPPADVTKLSFPSGATTSTIPDVFSQAVPGTTPYDVELNPGDIVYIPPLWLHAAKPLTPCVAVNVFFRNLSDKAYPHGRDVYASRDLAAYEKGRKKLEGIIKDFRKLPKDVKTFYLLRLAEELKDGAKK
ncbi:hypothetical protein BDD12DRAFT_931378 [Trichophaea hybrida]|nr:hypothetical protein BDD12DRAFT_931378 [Trichophaea hybrida]